MKLAGVIALFALGLVSGTEKQPTNNRHQRASGRELFLSIVGERPKEGSNVKGPILPVHLPIQLGGEGGITLPVLVVPVPVYINNPDSCSANHHGAEKPAEPALPNIPIVQIRQQIEEALHPNADQQLAQLIQQQNSHQEAIEINKLQEAQPTPSQPEVQPTYQPIVQPAKPIYQPLVQPAKPIYQPIKTYTSSKVIIPAPAVHIPAHKENVKFNFNLGNRLAFKDEPQTVQEPVSFEQVTTVAEENIPFADGSSILFDTSEKVIQAFLRQAPVGPEQPAVIPGLNLPQRLPSDESVSTSITAAAPARPDFNRSLRLRVDLHVPRSDYTEAYDISWHSESNTARTVVEDGSTVIYRAPLEDGRVQFLEIQLEPTDGQIVRRCTLSPLIQPSPAEKGFPGLPAFDKFEFAGYTSVDGRSLVEHWRYVVTSKPGEGGAADGETLTFKHEFYIVRDRGEAVPLRYTVVTDSSVIGPASDSYTHRYNLLPTPTAAVLPDTAKDCDTFEDFQDHDVEHDHSHGHQKRDIGSVLSRVVSKFDPMREFSGPTRDTKYDSILTKFKKQFKRKYINPAEEAVRKNLLIKSSRFIEAGNRLSSGFKMAANFLSDRLDDEINELLGVQAPPKGESEPGLVPFPFSEKQVKNFRLENEFDWRPLGAVSPVRYQDTCSSCWAFAVAGSTEGALFKKTNRMVPLSPQCLVDCGHAFGTHGCNGTWPSFAYDYVQARGLPAWDEYTNYQAKVLECKDKIVPPVTHIAGHVNVTSNSEAALKVAIKEGAPTVVIVDAKAQSFIYYKSGVLKDKRCGQNKPRLNHAVLAVGWGSKDGPHFIIKNTWTAKWGEGGYIRIAPDSCAVLERPSYSLVDEPNIDREELRAAAASLSANAKSN